MNGTDRILYFIATLLPVSSEHSTKVASYFSTSWDICQSVSTAMGETAKQANS